MSINAKSWKKLRCSKRKTLRIGRRSIYDIIKDPRLDFGDKIDYIRHHYVYYEGNYEYFHDESGKANKRKEELNSLICRIIQRLADPKELKQLNKKILKEHRLKLAKQKIEEEKAMEKYYATIKESKYELEVNLWLSKHPVGSYSKENLDLIKEYLLKNKNRIELSRIKFFTYKMAKAMAKKWKKDLEIEKEKIANNIFYFDEEKIKHEANENNKIEAIV